MCELFGELDTDIVNNRGIVSKHLGGKEPHVNPYENASLALNFQAIRKLWIIYGNSGKFGYHGDAIFAYAIKHRCLSVQRWK